MAKKEKAKEKGFLSGIISNQLVKSLLLMVVITGVLIALSLFGLNTYTKHGEAVAVPSVKGMQIEEAASLLKQASLAYEVIDSIYLTDGTPGAITDQIPEGGSNVKKDRVIFLTMQAKSVEMVTIPVLKDFSQRQAIATLHSLGFKNISINEVASAYRGLVIDVSYKGQSIEITSKIPKGAPLTLTVGAGGEVLIDSLIDIIPDMKPEDLYKENPSVDNSFFE